MQVYPSRSSDRRISGALSRTPNSHGIGPTVKASDSTQSAYSSHSINTSSPVKGALWSQHNLLRKITLYEDFQDNQGSDQINSYIQTYFHKKECQKFVPKQEQLDFVKKVKDLRCHCGEVLEKHEAMRKYPGTTRKKVVPQELSALVNHPDAPIPVSLPIVPWDKKNSLTEEVTNAFGKLIFSVTMIGGMKPAKYLRLSDTDPVDKLIDCMVKYWRIMEPKPPNLVISVVGGAKNFKLDGRNRDTFHSGLIKAAKTTSAWLITSGFNMGVMKAVGQAVHKGQTLTWDNDRMAHNIRCIGLAPWGYVEDREKLIVDHDEPGSIPIVLKPNSCIQHNSPVPINPDHTHFVFVDNGMRNSYSGVANFRASFERKISLPTKGEEETGLGIPVVIVVVEGGVDAIRAVATSIEQEIPVVVCSGTGRAADILSYAYAHTVTTRRYMNKKHLGTLELKLYQAYGQKWSGGSGEEEMTDIKQLVLQCCQQDNLITIFHMEKDEDLDLAVLSALLKAKGTSNVEQQQNQLRLALTWNRCDIVQDQIFKEDINWPPGSLDEIMTEALLQEDRVNFVQLLIQQGFAMKDYLTVRRLEYLYNAIPQHCHLRKMLQSKSHGDVYFLLDVKRLLNQLLDVFDDSEYNHIAANPSHWRLSSDQFTGPYRELFLWAVLMNRQNLAKLCWEMGEDTVASAIIATRLYLSMSKNVAQHEHVLKQIFINNKDEFELLATSVLDECQAVDPDKAMMLVEKPSPYWCHVTGLQMAAAAHDQVFLSVSTCQNSINLTWKRGVLSSWRRVACAMFFPLLIWPLIKLEDEDVGCLKKAYLFYKAPITKFAANSVMYLLFLCTYSYMILFDFKPDISITEMICIIWIFTFLVDEIHCLLAFPTPTLTGKFRDWYGFLNRLDLLNLILVFIGFFLRLYPPYFQHTKAIYCLNCVSFFLRIMKLYKANSFLGPKLYMIVRMIEELLLFVSILLVFLLAYGVSSQSLLWPNREPYWGILKDILYYPYWQIYGELFLDEIETDAACYSLYSNSSSGMLNQIPCRTFSFLVPFLLAAYLLIGNVLLLNLLIAIFSHTFDEVQKNTLEIWKYQVYFLVMEYDIKTFLVPPFSIFEHVYLFVKYFVKKSNCRKTQEKSSMSRKQFQYLQVFEKEMMANFLRIQKAEELNSIDYKFLKIEKRVDEMTKLIEDEVIADQQQYDWEATLISSGIPRGTTPSPNQPKDQPDWPSPEEVQNLDQSDDLAKTMEDLVEGQIKERRKEKKKKKKKKHKQRDVMEDSEDINIGKDLRYPSQIVSQGRLPVGTHGLRKRRSNLSSRNIWMDDDDLGYNRHSHRYSSAMEEREKAVWSDNDIDFSDMVPLESVSHRSSGVKH